MSPLVRPRSPRKPTPPKQFRPSGAVNEKYDEQLDRYHRNLIKYEQLLQEYKLALHAYHNKLKQLSQEKAQSRLARLSRQERDLEVKLKRVQKQLLEEINFEPESFCSASQEGLF